MFSEEEGSPTNGDKETKLRKIQAGFSSLKVYTSPFSPLSLYSPLAVQPSLFQTGQETQKKDFLAKPFVSK